MQGEPRIIWRGGVGTHVLRLISNGRETSLEVQICGDALGKENFVPCDDMINADVAVSVIKILGCVFYKRAPNRKELVHADCATTAK